MNPATFSLKKIQIPDLGRDGFQFCQSAWFCLYQQAGQDSLGAFEAIERL